MQTAGKAKSIELSLMYKSDPDFYYQGTELTPADDEEVSVVVRAKVGTCMRTRTIRCDVFGGMQDLAPPAHVFACGRASSFVCLTFVTTSAGCLSFPSLSILATERFAPMQGVCLVVPCVTRMLS